MDGFHFEVTPARQKCLTQQVLGDYDNKSCWCCNLGNENLTGRSQYTGAPGRFEMNYGNFPYRPDLYTRYGTHSCGSMPVGQCPTFDKHVYPSNNYANLDYAYNAWTARNPEKKN